MQAAFHKFSHSDGEPKLLFETSLICVLLALNIKKKALCIHSVKVGLLLLASYRSRNEVDTLPC